MLSRQATTSLAGLTARRVASTSTPLRAFTTQSAAGIPVAAAVSSQASSLPSNSSLASLYPPAFKHSFQEIERARPDLTTSEQSKVEAWRGQPS